MAITISGQNNNDKIVASDGVLDMLSGFNVVGVMTANSFDVGSNIKLGNAGIITATTVVGNVTGNLTGNINHTSNILLQISGSEKFRVGTSGQFGIAGANYGTSGQVLTSGGASAAPTWGAAGKVLQVVHAEKPDHFLSADTTFADVASLSVTITPTSSSTKMLITVHVFANCEDAAILRLVRYRADLGTAAIGNGQAGTDASTRGFAMVRQDDGNLGSGYSMQTLHTPGTTVEHTYKVQARATSGSNALAINRRVDDASYGLVSSISVMEIG